MSNNTINVWDQFLDKNLLRPSLEQYIITDAVYEKYFKLIDDYVLRSSAASLLESKGKSSPHYYEKNLKKAFDDSFCADILAKAIIGTNKADMPPSENKKYNNYLNKMMSFFYQNAHRIIGTKYSQGQKKLLFPEQEAFAYTFFCHVLKNETNYNTIRSRIDRMKEKTGESYNRIDNPADWSALQLPQTTFKFKKVCGLIAEFSEWYNENKSKIEEYTTKQQFTTKIENTLDAFLKYKKKYQNLDQLANYINTLHAASFLLNIIHNMPEEDVVNKISLLYIVECKAGFLSNLQKVLYPDLFTETAAVDTEIDSLAVPEDNKQRYINLLLKTIQNLEREYPETKALVNSIQKAIKNNPQNTREINNETPQSPYEILLKNNCLASLAYLQHINKKLELSIELANDIVKRKKEILEMIDDYTLSKVQEAIHSNYQFSKDFYKVLPELLLDTYLPSNIYNLHEENANEAFKIGDALFNELKLAFNNDVLGNIEEASSSTEIPEANQK